MRIYVFVLAALAALMMGGFAFESRAQEPEQRLKGTETGRVNFTSGTYNVWGFLNFPAGAQGRVPVVILAHHTGGYGSTVRTWARHFRNHGLATFELDYFSGRGVNMQNPRSLPAPEIDLHTAAKLLITDPRIDPERLVAFGQSRGANMVAMLSNRPTSLFENGKFAAFVQIYPSCKFTPTTSGSTAPILVLLGDKDDDTPLKDCQDMVERGKQAGRDVRLNVYAGGTHLFDDESENRGTFFSQLQNKRVTYRYTSSLAEQARKDVVRFLVETVGAKP